jgi:hypothetical protein
MTIQSLNRNDNHKLVQFQKWLEMSYTKEVKKAKPTRLEIYSNISPLKPKVSEVIPKNLTKTIDQKVYCTIEPKTLTSVKSFYDIKQLNKCKSSFSKTLFNTDIFNKEFSLNQADTGLRKYFQANPDNFKKRVSKGPPQSFRWLSWMILAGIGKTRNDEMFQSLLNRNIDSQVNTQIKKDLNRTLSERFMFEESNNYLYNVLKVYAVNDEEVGYCQGMNFIAGFLLIMSDFSDSEAFYMMNELFNKNFGGEHQGLRGFYTNDFPLLKMYTYIFDRIFKETLPDLYAHFNKIDIPSELWVGKWFQTLYIICLPFDLLVRVWDCLFVVGSDFLFCFAVALLKYCEGSLLKLNDFPEISEFFKTMNPNCYHSKSSMKIDIEELIHNALKIELNKEQIKKWEKEFEIKIKLEICNQTKILNHSTSVKRIVFNKKCVSQVIEGNLNMDLFLKSNSSVYMNTRQNTNTKEEESKRSTADEEVFQENSESVDEGFNNTFCSEFDLFDNRNVIKHNISTHILKTNINAENKYKHKRMTNLK